MIPALIFASLVLAQTTECTKLSDKFAERYTVSFKRHHEVGFSDAVRAFAEASRPLCEDAASSAQKQALDDAIAGAPKVKVGKASKKLTELSNVALAKKPPATADAVELLSATATANRKRLVNEYGVPMGTTQRVSLVVRVKETDKCLELRGDWRISTLQDDQDEPEYLVLDRMRGGALGWRNLSNYDFDDLTPAFSVACPKARARK